MSALSDLLALWAERDSRYGTRKMYGPHGPLTQIEIDSIRVWRRREVDALPVDDRARAWNELNAWVPPTPMR